MMMALFIGTHQAFPQTRELGGTGELLDGVAALVDTGVVLRSELNQRVQMVVDGLQRVQEQLPPEQRQPIAPLPIIGQFNGLGSLGSSSLSVKDTQEST